MHDGMMMDDDGMIMRMLLASMQRSSSLAGSKTATLPKRAGPDLGASQAQVQKQAHKIGLFDTGSVVDSSLSAHAHQIMHLTPVELSPCFFARPHGGQRGPKRANDDDDDDDDDARSPTTAR